MKEKRNCEALGCHRPAVGRFTVDMDLNSPKRYNREYTERFRLCKDCKKQMEQEGRLYKKVKP